jgi:hypothetical protein
MRYVCSDKYLQRIKQCLRIVLTLINGRRRRAALEQDVDRFPRRADRAFDGEGYFPRNLDVLADEPEIGRPLWDWGRPVATAPGQPDIVDVGYVRRIRVSWREAAGANMEVDASDDEQTERYSNHHKIPTCVIFAEQLDPPIARPRGFQIMK